jgi:hypothetical protein
MGIYFEAREMFFTLAPPCKVLLTFFSRACSLRERKKVRFIGGHHMRLRRITDPSTCNSAASLLRPSIGFDFGSIELRTSIRPSKSPLPDLDPSVLCSWWMQRHGPERIKCTAAQGFGATARSAPPNRSRSNPKPILYV